MEEKLREFKNRRRREEFINKNKELLRSVMEKVTFRSPSPAFSDTSDVNQPLIETNLSSPKSPLGCSIDNISIASSNTSIDLSLSSVSWFTIITYTLYFLLWGTVYLIAIHFEFGMVYLVISGLLFIYFNTRTGPKKEGEVSAYSVFNPNCEAIDGTLKAEQFEREFNLIKHVTVSPVK